MAPGGKGPRVDAAVVRNIVGTNLAPGSCRGSRWPLIHTRDSKARLPFGYKPEVLPLADISAQNLYLRFLVYLEVRFTVVPSHQVSDPTREQLAHKLLVGQRATWPKIHMVLPLNDIAAKPTDLPQASHRTTD